MAKKAFMAEYIENVVYREEKGIKDESRIGKTI